MVVDLLDDESTAERFPRQRSPTGALHGRGCGRQLLPERLEAAEVALERRGELALRLAVAVRRQVLPEQRMQDVTGHVERQALLELADIVETPLLARVV